MPVLKYGNETMLWKEKERSRVRDEVKDYITCVPGKIENGRRVVDICAESWFYVGKMYFK